MRLCDFLAEEICKRNIDTVFMVSGGGLLYLSDGLACNQKLKKICCHHEQAAAMAAVAYSEYKGMGCAFVTTGCGGTNTITGVLHAWQDNTPCLFVSGQVKVKETLSYVNMPIRQVGVQEANIVEIVKSITKYAVMITDPNDILYHIEKAFYLARHGRPGPVWLDIPLDVSYAEIEPEKLRHFDPSELKEEKSIATPSEINDLIRELKNAKRPVIIAGHGIRLAGAADEFYELVHKLKIPVVFSRLGLDALPVSDEYNMGSIGNRGTRAGNMTMQNADLLIAMGSRLAVSSTGQQYEYFAREAKVIAIDIDKYEHQKNTVHVDQMIVADAKNVIERLLNAEELNDYSADKWAKCCLEWRGKYPACLPEYYDDSQGINLYAFTEELSKCLKDDSVVVTDSGSTFFVPAQTLKTSDRKQRYITSGAQAEMGFALPGSVGASAAKGFGEAVAIIGDGSFQMNIQELQTIVHNKLPVKIFIWNNDGYLSIRASQSKYFKQVIGTDSTNGVSFPDLSKIAYAYGIKYVKIDSLKTIREQINGIIAENEPVLCEVICIRDQPILPTVSSKKLPGGKFVSAPLEDMFPFLPRDEFKENMIVKPINID